MNIILGAVLAIILVLSGTIYFMSRPTGTQGNKEITLNIVSTKTDYNTTETYKTDAEFLGDFLVENEIITFSEGDFGRFITAVGDMEADDTKEFWSISANDANSMFGIDETPLTDGFTYKLELVSFG